MIAEGRHQGAQLAIFKGDQLALALCAGTDVATGKPIDFDDLFGIRSTTKAVTGLVMARLFEKGLFKYEDAVAKHWPAFGQNGKGNISIAMVLAHQAGIPRVAVPLARMGDLVFTARALEAAKPEWTPGDQNGYHPLSGGMICDELARRWTGKSIAVLLLEGLAREAGASNLWIGLPRSQAGRFRPIAVLDGKVTAERAAFSDFVNSVDGMAMPLSAVCGVANAIDLARFFNLVSLSGDGPGGRQLSQETLALIGAPRNPEGMIDLNLRWPVRWGLGVITGATPSIFGATPRPWAFGHAGGGANVAWGDPRLKISVAFLCNGMRTGGADWERYRILGDLVYRAMESR
ncbi:MAG: beta-lactamase family protein [Spirochaetes bacterium]|nr:beta-lactamase family protein [Spirochaetota bacterium]